MHREDYSDEFLTELSNTFDLDEIYAYNSEGIIEYSNSGKYIGWKAYEGHPVYDFMNGDEEIIEKEIRAAVNEKDTSTCINSLLVISSIASRKTKAIL